MKDKDKLTNSQENKPSNEMFIMALAEVQKTFNVKEQKLFEKIILSINPENPKEKIKLNKEELIEALWPGITGEKTGRHRNYYCSELKKSMDSMIEKLSKIGDYVESEHIDVELKENFLNEIVKKLEELKENIK